MANKVISAVFIVLGLSLAVFVFILFLRIEEAREEKAKLRQQKAKVIFDMRHLLEHRELEKFKEDKLNVKDEWETPYKSGFYESKERAVITYFISSAGPDKVWGTEDDIKRENSDINFTNSGQATGKRVGAAGRGFIKGLLKSGDGK